MRRCSVLIALGLALAACAPSRAQLIEGVSGAWRRLERDCSTTVRFRVERDDDGVYRIFGSAAGAADSVVQVGAIDTTTGWITARVMNGSSEVWEYHPRGDMLDLRDPRGVMTALARCPAAQ